MKICHPGEVETIKLFFMQKLGICMFQGLGVQVMDE